MAECAECGFVYDDIGPTSIGAALSSLGRRIRDALAAAAPTHLTRRPDPTTWSALEYGCHVRDVFLVQRDRVLLALVDDTPRFVTMHRDERVTLAGYSAEEPADVMAEVEMAARMLARLFGRLTDEQLARRCIYTFPSPAEVDVAWVGRHSVHEGEHHLKDIAGVLRRVGAPIEPGMMGP